MERSEGVEEGRRLCHCEPVALFLSSDVIKLFEIYLEIMTKDVYTIIVHLVCYERERYGMKEEIRSIRLKQLRQESKITQEQLAEYLDVDQSLITKLENGTRNLSVGLIEKICSLFGCSERYLLGEDDAYIPLNFAFRSKGVETEDLESIAVINKIAMNIRFMNEMIGEE